MLPLIYIRENQKALKQGLAKRNFAQPELIDKIIEIDQSRRALQAELDDVLAKSNKLAKEIGSLFKTGKAEEANVLKKETITLKQLSKSLQEELQEAEKALLEVRTQVPNVPHESVPSGNSEDDNE